jgi:hypothetical protein
MMADPAIAAPAAPAAPPSPQSATPPAARPGVISDTDYNALATDADRDRFARVRQAGPDGGSEWQDRSTLPSEPADPTKTGDGKAAVTENGLLRIGSMELNEADIQKIMTEAAAREARRANMPASAAEYKLDLPADFVVPEGQAAFKWSTDHPVLGPIIGQAKEFALANGIDQAGFSKMMGLYASAQMQEAVAFAKAQAAEVAKLGPNITARVDAVNQFVRGMVGDDKPARAISRSLYSADQVVAFERIIRKVTSQDSASFSQAHREPYSQPGRVSEEQYEAMSAAEKWDYARGFDQSQFKPNGRG